MHLDAELLKLQDNPTPIPNKYFYVIFFWRTDDGLQINIDIQDKSKLLIVHAWVSWHQRPCAILSTDFQCWKPVFFSWPFNTNTECNSFATKSWSKKSTQTVGHGHITNSSLTPSGFQTRHCCANCRELVRTYSMPDIGWHGASNLYGLQCLHKSASDLLDWHKEASRWGHIWRVRKERQRCKTYHKDSQGHGVQNSVLTRGFQEKSNQTSTAPMKSQGNCEPGNLRDSISWLLGGGNWMLGTLETN